MINHLYLAEGGRSMQIHPQSCYNTAGSVLPHMSLVFIELPKCLHKISNLDMELLVWSFNYTFFNIYLVFIYNLLFTQRRPMEVILVIQRKLLTWGRRWNVASPTRHAAPNAMRTVITWSRNLPRAGHITADDRTLQMNTIVCAPHPCEIAAMKTTWLLSIFHMWNENSVLRKISRYNEQVKNPGMWA